MQVEPLRPAGEIRHGPRISVVSFGIVFAFLFCIGLILLYHVPVPGRFAQHGTSTHDLSGMTHRCFALEYPDQPFDRWRMYAVELALEPGPLSTPEAPAYRATGWLPDRDLPPGTQWPSTAPHYSQMAWTYAGPDSVDVEWHHSPVLRLPIEGEGGIGRIGYRNHYSLAAALATPENSVRSTRIPCSELPREAA